MAELKLFSPLMVVLYVFTAAHLCSAGRSRSSSMEKVESPDGDIIDYVHISHQHAFDHPLLKNHTIKTRPNYYPNWVKDYNIKSNASKVEPLTSSSSEAITQLWHSNGKCPKGTIPVIKTKKEDVLRADSVKSYGKRSFLVAQPGSIDPELTDVRNHHEYAIAITEGLYYGAKATFNLWNPMVQENNEFSLGQLWISRGSNSNLNTIEAGWHSDDYQRTGCYNLICPGFIQTNNEIVIGGNISPTSQIDGSQYEITILIWKDGREGDWWMQLGDEKVIGYWPASLFSDLSDSAPQIQWGGEVINLGVNRHHTTTQMGSGHFPVEGFGKASYIRNIETVDEFNTLSSPKDLNTYTPQQSCYDIVKGINENWGSHFFYGGPGQNQNCP
ncbi:hypothetical protein L1987_00951 [Smallanthus sonchifolius]|uniref:Uncharacterized protein n=1 Tax=Smallanthus sonchifolius TaxID=185202 RepID=A0ACB9K3J2_9ASTR|nr:hypothetical protein L1987_00951 [Smallanthus sonchifolius]